MITEKLSLEVIANAFIALQSLSSDTRMEIELQWRVTDLIEALEKNAKRFFEEKNKLLEEYGNLIPGTKQYVINPEKEGEHSAKFNKLKSNKFEVSFLPLEFEELKSNKVTPTSSELLALKTHFITRNNPVDADDSKDTGKKDK